MTDSGRSGSRAYPRASPLRRSSGAVVEYTLRDVAKQIGVSTYRVTRELPAPLKQDLPSIEDLQDVVEKLRNEFEAARQLKQADEDEQ